MSLLANYKLKKKDVKFNKVYCSHSLVEVSKVKSDSPVAIISLRAVKLLVVRFARILSEGAC